MSMKSLLPPTVNSTPREEKKSMVSPLRSQRARTRFSRASSLLSWAVTKSSTVPATLASFWTWEPAALMPMVVQRVLPPTMPDFSRRMTLRPC